ncbi:hypothetical protein C923_00108 [Plasmodium falciparum UGT5.1]|uniref:Uncharacterized protein n=1 Tax=Plasmodium falciparum UGT5.1 TaxID=1237627 RepID=W7K582_PLAFA|nr:hypothetical protein C923_00108 [Plasmodium falciparum UGT5.1]
MGSHERIFRHLIQALGASLIASSAYQKWPTWISTRSSIRLSPDFNLITLSSKPLGSYQICSYSIKHNCLPVLYAKWGFNKN